MEDLRVIGAAILCRVLAGAQVHHVAQQLVQRANTTEVPHVAQFNDVTLLASPGDDPEKVAQIYWNRRRG